MASNVPKVKRSCQTCGRAHTVSNPPPDRWPGVVMLDAESGLHLCHACWFSRPIPPGERHGPDRPNNRIR